ncbi:hypothetical protein ABVL1U2_500028 [Acinetobacter baumannii]|nr:hypothetical protein ABVL1U2_500028 [Acinetobacter baumannii]
MPFLLNLSIADNRPQLLLANHNKLAALLHAPNIGVEKYAGVIKQCLFLDFERLLHLAYYNSQYLGYLQTKAKVLFPQGFAYNKQLYFCGNKSCLKRLMQQILLKKKR